MKNNYKLILLCAGILFIIGVAGYFIMNNAVKVDFSAAYNSVEDGISINDDSQDIYVHIKGCVQTPGVYKLLPESRVKDAIMIAGGATEDADLDAVNLAKKVKDASEIYIPSIYGDDSTLGISYDGKIDINKADIDQLKSIPGVGDVIAEKIIAYRDKNGNFSSIEEIMEVSGIGQKTFNNIEEYIVVN